MEHVALLIISLYAVIQGAGLASRYAERLASGMHLSRYLVGFVIVSFISILPETFIAINAALRGNPSFGVGTILGSNVADLTLIMAILIFVAGRGGLRVEKSLYRKLRVYPLFLLIPPLLGLDGEFSRAEGLSLIIIGIIFYFFVFSKSVGISSRSREIRNHLKNIALLVVSMGILLAAAHFTVTSATSLAEQLAISPLIIGILIVGLGTTIPELFFSVRAIRNKQPQLAIGDVMGSVLADATIVIGVVAMISPFEFPPAIAQVAGGFMFASSVILLLFMRSKYRLNRLEGSLLALVWVVYIITEIFIAQTVI